MLDLDGSTGGGQLLRTALSLSAVSGTPFRLSGIREGRPKPGLRPQHLAAVRLLAEVTAAEVSRASVGTEALTFEPGTLQLGDYEVDIGTAGSATLLFDAILPLATVTEGAISVRVRGGTDVRWSPTMDYYRQVKLALLRRHGLAAAVDVDRRGFYPTGGGDATLRLWPSSPTPFDLTDPPGTGTARVSSIASDDLADRDVAGRQVDGAQTVLDAMGVDVRERHEGLVVTDATGSAIVVRLDRGGILAGADALGERGTPAETVGERAAAGIRRVVESGAAVDRHLADQLVVFLGLVGGRVTYPDSSDHVQTNAAILGQFGFDVAVGDDGDYRWVEG